MQTLYFVFILGLRKCDSHLERPETQEQIAGAYGETRRILRGMDITDTRPYMVYLRAATATEGHSAQVDPNWLCGGVIIHPRYILTSAACIEDVVHFYVISGTHKWLPVTETNDCITYGATRAIWKCVPKSYRYDGGVFNNIRWMVNDIAVVMVESDFSFSQRVKGCDFIPKSIAYNNHSHDMETPGTLGAIAGWGSTEKYTDGADLITRTNVNSPNLMEAQVIVVPKSSCTNLWLPRYHQIIDKYMICGKNIPMEEMSQACDDNLACRELVYSEEDLPALRRRNHNISNRRLLRSLTQLKRRGKTAKSGRKSSGKSYGGFCENDHGGPLIVGFGRSSLVVGIISAYRNVDSSKSCTGPFLYSSVWNNRHLIDCALYKNIETACTILLRSSGTVLDEEHIDWGEHDKQIHSKNQKKNALRSGNTKQNVNKTARASLVSAFTDREEEEEEEQEKEPERDRKEVEEGETTATEDYDKT